MREEESDKFSEGGSKGMRKRKIRVKPVQIPNQSGGLDAVGPSLQAGRV